MGQGIIAHIDEKAFQTIVVTTAREHGWMVKNNICEHSKSEPGFPDLVMVKEGKILFVELRSDKDKFTAEKHEWLKALSTHQRNCGSTFVQLWPISEWDRIKEIHFPESDTTC